jgi:selenide,water dikinase
MSPQGIAQVLRHLPAVNDPNLIVGTETHDDAGVYRLTDDLALVQTLDFFPPVVDDPFVYGQIAAANAISDVYAMGGTPKTALNLVGFPDDKLDLDLLGQILAGGAERCGKAGVTIVGGHTVRDAEIKFGLSVTGVVHPKRVITNAAAKPGDILVLTKPLGTGLVATANKKGECPPELYAAACASMVQLNDVGRDAMLAAGVRCATDVTGFALAGHGLEMATGSKVTLQIDLAKLPLLPDVEAIARPPYLNRASKTNRAYVQEQLRIDGTPDSSRLECFFDPQTSGGLLVCLAPAKVEGFLAQVRAGGATGAVVIGEVLAAGTHALVLRA